MNHPRTLLVLCCLTVAVVLVAVAVSLSTAPGGPVAPAPVPAPASTAASATVAAIDVLRAWDARRSRAWARGDVRGLRRLYTPGSRSGRHDRAALAAYVGRGLRVTDLRTQVLGVDVKRRTGRLLVLRVTDRMTGGVARAPGRSVRLPRDRPTSWRLVLRRAAGEWRVGEVRREPTPGPR